MKRMDDEVVNVVDSLEIALEINNYFLEDSDLKYHCHSHSLANTDDENDNYCDSVVVCSGCSDGDFVESVARC